MLLLRIIHLSILLLHLWSHLLLRNLLFVWHILLILWLFIIQEIKWKQWVFIWVLLSLLFRWIHLILVLDFNHIFMILLLSSRLTLLIHILVVFHYRFFRNIKTWECILVDLFLLHSEAQIFLRWAAAGALKHTKPTFFSILFIISKY